MVEKATIASMWVIGIDYGTEGKAAPTPLQERCFPLNGFNDQQPVLSITDMQKSETQPLPIAF